MDQAGQLTLKFHCAPELQPILPRPIPAVRGMPDWFKAVPQKSYNPTMGTETHTVKKCPPFIDAMTFGFLIPLTADLEVRNGEFSWNLDAAKRFVSDYSHSPIGFHECSQLADTPFANDERFIIEFNNLWTIEAPPGYSVLFTHPINRGDLPFTTLTGLIDCDKFPNSPVRFPARWRDQDFNGVLRKGTPVAQCIPVRRETWVADFETLSSEKKMRLIKTRDAIRSETDVYRRQFRTPKR